MVNTWTRIPIDSLNESDRRTMVSILAAGGLEVRIMKVKEKTVTKRFVEYKETEASPG